MFKASSKTLKKLSFNEQYIGGDLKTDLKTGRYIRLIVSDTGHGIGTEIQLRIFDPYFTTKEQGKGTGMGMGLSVVHGIVKNNGGTITVDSEPGKGTVFQIIFPVTEIMPKTMTEKHPAVPQGQERILLVDDETAFIDEAGRIQANL